MPKQTRDLNQILKTLDTIAREKNTYQYGLPIGDDEYMVRMRDALQQWLNQPSNTGHKDKCLTKGKGLGPGNLPFDMANKFEFPKAS